LKLLSSD